MKKNLFALLAIIGALFAFKPATNVYKVDVSKSKIEWIGRKITGQHAGELRLASGILNSNGNSLAGGNFVIDMSSISNTDLDKKSAQKLLGHLKSDDFFSIEKNPTAKFEISNVKSVGVDKVTITGKLTIKGISNDVSFPASVKQKGNILVAVANGVRVDRTKFDIKYGSSSFITGIGDKAIDDEFELNINLVAIR